MAITLNGSTGITTPTYGGSVSAEYITPVTGFKNRIINGDMRIDQRNGGASVTPTSGQYPIDRWQAALTQSSKYSVQQNAGAVTPPAGFTNYLGVTSLSAYTVLTGDLFDIRQKIEGFNISDLAWGTANAQTITLSFWVRSSLTGTFGGAIKNAAATRSYPFTYTISSANTWEQKTITIAGDTSGTWLTGNNAGMQVGFGLGVGSTYSGTAGEWAGFNFVSATGATSVVGTNGATFYVTGVQLEKGDTATSFDYRPYGTELALCQRYYQSLTNIWDNAISGFLGTINNNDVICSIRFNQFMRATPTVTTYSEDGTAGRVSMNRLASGYVTGQLGFSVAGGTLLNSSGANRTGVSNVTFKWKAEAEL